MGVEGIRAGLGNGLVGAENEMQGAVEYECIFLDDVRQRGVGGQPQRRVRAHVADVVAAVSRLAGFRAVVAGRPKPNAYSRRAGLRPYAPQQHHRREHSAHVFIARSDVAYPHGAAIRVVQHGVEDGGVGLVSLLAMRKIDEFDFEEARQFGLAVVPQQSAKHGV